MDRDRIAFHFDTSSGGLADLALAVRMLVAGRVRLYLPATLVVDCVPSEAWPMTFVDATPERNRPWTPVI